MDKNKDKNWWQPGLVIFTKVSASVAIPIILALIIGKWLDTKYGTTPWIFLGLTAIAFAISLISIWRSLSDYMETLKKEESPKETKDTTQ